MLEIPIQNFMGRSYSDTFVGGRYHINLQEDAYSLFRLGQVKRTVDIRDFKDYLLEEDLKRLEV
jgi:hypothetical protein